MKTDRKIISLILILSVFCTLFWGCSFEEEKTDAEMAAELFGQGNFAEAENYFLSALDFSSDEVLRLGHAYNLVELQKYDAAVTEFLLVQDSFDNATAVQIRKTILDIYLKQGNMSGAARVYDELATLSSDTSVADDYRIEAATVRADIYREQGDAANLEKELRKLIGLKVFADNEYYEIYSLYIEKAVKEERLQVADEIIGYMTGHSAYISDYSPLLTVVFDAADVAQYTEWTRTSEDYFVIAEGFIEKAGDEGLPENISLKYQIIIAERRGKMELALSLLGVYLNHCPDDEMAQKEVDYLKNRLGLGE